MTTKVKEQEDKILKQWEQIQILTQSENALQNQIDQLISKFESHDADTR